MKKSYLFIALLLIIAVFLACKDMKDDVSPISLPTKTQIEKMETGQANKNDIEKVKPTQKAEENLVYVNEKCGYQITFPESWRGYYYINKYDDGEIGVFFLGKSWEYSTKLKDLTGTEGREIFFIMSENLLEGVTHDSITEIGAAKGVNYYYATGTSAAFIIPYSPTNPDAPLDYVPNPDLLAFSDEQEEKLYFEDMSKAQEMFREIPSILKTFTEI